MVVHLFYCHIQWKRIIKYMLKISVLILTVIHMLYYAGKITIEIKLTIYTLSTLMVYGIKFLNDNNIFRI